MAETDGRAREAGSLVEAGSMAEDARTRAGAAGSMAETPGQAKTAGLTWPGEGEGSKKYSPTN